MSSSGLFRSFGHASPNSLGTNRVFSVFDEKHVPFDAHKLGTWDPVHHKKCRPAWKEKWSDSSANLIHWKWWEFGNVMEVSKMVFDERILHDTVEKSVDVFMTSVVIVVVSDCLTIMREEFFQIIFNTSGVTDLWRSIFTLLLLTRGIQFFSGDLFPRYLLKILLLKDGSLHFSIMMCVVCMWWRCEVAEVNLSGFYPSCVVDRDRNGTDDLDHVSGRQCGSFLYVDDRRVTS